MATPPRHRPGSPRDLVAWLLRRPPRVWAIGYFALLVGFSGVYWGLPERSFEDPNLPLEPNVRSDAGQVRASLTSDLNRTPRPGHWSFRGEQARLLSRLRVDAVAKPPNETPAGIPISIHGESGTAHSYANWDAWFLVSVIGDIEERLGSPSAPTTVLLSAKPTGYGGVGSPVDTPLQPPNQVLLSHGGPEGGVLEITPATYRQLSRFFGAAQGDPTDASGDFWRMVYLSASTITTLGMGDIQPLTSWARLLVTAEAVLGLIVIGMFLNALALKAAAGRRS